MNLLDIFSHIPWFVWPLLYLGTTRGIKALNTHVTSIQKILIMPLVLMALGTNTLLVSNPPTMHILMWLTLLVATTIITRHMTRSLNIACDKKNRLIQLPGTWSTLGLFLTIFVTKFTFGCLLGIHPEWKRSFLFNFTSLALSGAICGISFGRLISILTKFFQGTQVDLQKSN